MAVTATNKKPKNLSPSPAPDLAVLDEVQQRVLWLATRIVDAANCGDKTEIKVGGHQASSASMVSIMSALWFAHLQPGDKVAVKPHASPVYHAIKYLTGELHRSWLTTLRQKGGLQAYPSRTKDPDVADFSTGSVGLGAVAPLFAAVTRRYVDAKFGGEGTPPRFIALIGDAELDEGSVWEAILDPITAGLGNVMVVVDLNRQSLDRVVPDLHVRRLAGFFENAGWHVAEAKYGRRLESAFAQPGGEALRAHIDSMPNEAYQHLFSLRGEDLRTKFLSGADPIVADFAGRYHDDELFELMTDLGGHDLDVLLETFRSCDEVVDRPSVVFAYTVKGWGLPIAGDALNHSALLSLDQIDHLRASFGLDADTEWDRFDPESPAGRLCSAVGANINNRPPSPRADLGVPSSVLGTVRGSVSSQEAFGRVLTRMADVEGVAERVVTVAPDVSVTTNLGGWINKAGVYAPHPRDDHGGADRLLRWAPAPSGRHIELGISEMNLFMLLGQLGLSHEHHGEQLLPIGAVYDPFVLRGLDALIYGVYNDSRFVVAGTPSGVTLAPEGGAHQSTVTASVGTELPNVTYLEPCFGTEVDWLLCDALRRLTDAEGESSYLRLSTRPIDQQPFVNAVDRVGEERLRDLVLAGGYRLKEAASSDDDRPGVTIVTTGALVPEALEAAVLLDDDGVAATVVHLTSPDRVYRSWQSRHRLGAQSGTVIRRPSHLHQLVPGPERNRPIISVHDASSHSLAWLGSALGVRQVALGVDAFGQSGSIADLQRIMGISAGDISNAALIALYELESN